MSVIKLTPLEPAYVVLNPKHKAIYLLLLVKINDNYGAYRLPLVKFKEKQVLSGNQYPYRLRRYKNKFVIEILKDIELMGGHIKIKKDWKSKYNICHDSKVQLILDWIKFLNVKKAKTK